MLGTWDLQAKVGLTLVEILKNLQVEVKLRLSWTKVGFTLVEILRKIYKLKLKENWFNTC